jgi:hypothetical protein
VTDYERNLEVFDEWTSLGGVFVRTERAIIIALPDISPYMGVQLENLYMRLSDPTPTAFWRRDTYCSVPSLKEEIAKGNAVRVRREDVKTLDLSLCSEGVRRVDKLFTAEEYIEQLRKEGEKDEGDVGFASPRFSCGHISINTGSNI